MCAEMWSRLRDAGLALEPTNIADDLLDVPGGHGIDFRHVAELPVVRSDAELRRAQKGGVAMVIRLINLVDQRRTLLSARGLWTMAG